MFPTFGEIDSISEFETEDAMEIQDKNELETLEVICYTQD